MPRPQPAKVFGSTFDDPRDSAPEQRDQERKEVVKQARHLANLRNDPDFLAKNVNLLHERRAGKPELQEFEAVPNDGIDAFVVPGELLVRRTDLDTDQVKELIKEFRLEVQELAVRNRTARSTPLVRLVEKEKDPARSRLRGRMAQLFDEVRNRRGITAVSLRYICPLGAVIKGEGGPEKSSGGRDFPPVVEGLPDIVVAVVDTGITAEKRGDRWLQNLLDTDNEDKLDVIPQPDGALDLAAGHGTFVSGVIQQVAPQATLRVLRAMDTDGVGTDSDVGDMMIQAVADGAKIINLSLGTQTLDDEGPLALRVALETVFDMDPDVLVVAAAGNYGDTRPCWPAAFAQSFDNVVAVGGLTPGGVVGAPWSSHGSWVTCSAIGEGVVSTYVIGTEDPRVDDPPDTFEADSWATWTGTSFAAPQVAAAVARRWQEHPSSTPRATLDQLLTEGMPLTGFGTAMTILPGT